MQNDLIIAIADAVAAKLQPKSPRKLYDLKLLVLLCYKRTI